MGIRSIATPDEIQRKLLCQQLVRLGWPTDSELDERALSGPVDQLAAGCATAESPDDVGLSAEDLAERVLAGEPLDPAVLALLEPTLPESDGGHAG